MSHRRNTEYSNCITEQAHGGLGPGNLSLFRGKANFPGTKTFIPWQILPNMPLGENTEVGSLCPSSKPPRKPWISLTLFSYKLYF